MLLFAKLHVKQIIIIIVIIINFTMNTNTTNEVHKEQL